MSEGLTDDFSRFTPGQKARFDELNDQADLTGDDIEDLMRLQVVLGDLEIVTPATYRITEQGERKVELGADR